MIFDEMKPEFLIKKLERTLEDNPRDAAACFEMGKLQEDLGDLNSSLTHYEKAVQLDPHLTQAHFQLGVVYSRMKSHDMAVREWQRMLDGDGDFDFENIDYFLRAGSVQLALREWDSFAASMTDNAANNFSAGLAFACLGRLDEALKYLNRAVLKNPSLETGRFHAGLCHARKAGFESAVREFQEELKIRPNHPQVLYALGSALLEEGKFAQAAPHLEKVVSARPGHIKALYRLALAAFRQGHMEDALGRLDRLLELKAGFAPAHHLRGLVYEKQFNMELAMLSYNRCLELEPENKEAHFQLAMLLKSLGKYEPALEHFQKTVQIDPNDSDAYHCMGLLHAQMGKYSDSTGAFRKALDISPDHAYARYSLAQALFQAGRHEEAIEEYKKLLQSNPRDTAARSGLGIAYITSGQLTMAISEFKKALEFNPRDAYAHYSLGAAYFRLGHLDLAIEEYQKALELNPTSAYAHFNLGATYSRGGQFELAIQEYRMAASMIPSNESDLELFATLQLQAAVGIESAQRGQELQASYEKLNQAYVDTVKSLSKAIDARDPYTNRHSERVARISAILAGKMGLKDEDLDDIEVGGYLHDVGKLNIPDSILLKQGPLTEDEAARIRMHPRIGAEVLSPVGFLRDLIPLVRGHHEKLDGSGYPDALKGDEIPIGARILAVADYYDALTTDRPYRAALSPQQALDEMEKHRGTHFDPGVLDAFNLVIDEIILTV
jgi:putative nucleotidyltransferase with HDIG domain